MLIRALEPTEGIELMRERRGRERVEDLCSGPGKLTEALGVGLDLNGRPLDREPFRIEPRRGEWATPQISAGPRIGITKAIGAALAPLRGGKPVRRRSPGLRFRPRPRSQRRS